MPDKDGNLLEWEQQIMDVLNGVLNPPREIDPDKLQEMFEDWNSTLDAQAGVRKQVAEKNPLVEDVTEEDIVRLGTDHMQQLGLPDDTKFEAMEFNDFKKLILSLDPPENEPYTKGETLNFIREVIEDVKDNSDLSIEEVKAFVEANFLTEWELEKTGKNKGQYVIKSDIRANVATTSDIPAYGVLYERSLELDADPRYMTDSDKFYMMLTQASITGKISDAMYSALTDKDIQEDPEQAAAVLQEMGFYPGDDPVATLDAINRRYMDDFWVIADEFRNDFRGKKNMEKAFRDLMGDDPMKVMPVYGRLQITDEQTFNRFIKSKFDISKTIDENIKAHMTDTDDSEGNSLDPNSKARGTTKEAKAFKAAMGDAQRNMVGKIEASPEGKAYIANPTPENLIAVYKLYENELHKNYGKNVQQILTDAFKSNYIAVRDNGTESQVNNLAADILFRIGIPAAEATKEDIADVISRMGNYEDKESFIRDETAKAEIRQAHLERVASNLFPFDTDDFPGQQKAVQAILMAMLNNGDITPAQYRAYAESSVEKQDFIASLMKGKKSEKEVMAVPQIIDSINEAIAEGEEKIVETGEEKAESERATLNRDINRLIFEDLQRRGIIDEESSPEFLQHIQDKVMADIQRKIILRGGIDAESEIEGIVGEHMGQLPIYERDDVAYQVQLAPTAEDVMAGRSLPPGVDPRKIAKPTPEFDISVFTPELQKIAIDNPELAGFISQEMQMPGFESEWQKAAEARPRKSYLDRAAAIELQEERLASFQRAAEVGEEPESIRAIRESFTIPGWSDTRGTAARARRLLSEELEKAEAGMPAKIQERREDVIRLENQVRAEEALEKAEAQAVREGSLASLQLAVEKEIGVSEFGRARQELAEAQELLRLTELPYEPGEEYIGLIDETEEAQRAVEQAEAALGVTPQVTGPAEAALKQAQAQILSREPLEVARFMVTRGRPGTIAEFREEIPDYDIQVAQNLADIKKSVYVQPGQTQEEFFETQLPGFERRFEVSPFFKQQEERMKRQTEIEEEEKRVADKKAETDRRTLLRSGRGVGAGTARTVFGRRQ